MSSVNVKRVVHACCRRPPRPFWRYVEASELRYRLAKGTLWSLAGAIVSRGLMLAAMVCVARILGTSVYGELGMIQATVGMFGIFAGFGLGLTATKHVAEFRDRDPLRAGRILGLSGLTAMLAGGLTALLLYALAPWLASRTINAPHLAGLLRVGTVLLFVSALNGAKPVRWPASRPSRALPRSTSSPGRFPFLFLSPARTVADSAELFRADG